MSWASAAAFYHSLSGLLRAGLPISESLRHAGGTAGGWHRQRATALSDACAAGSPLSDGLTGFGEQPMAVALVKAGERSGTLPETCEHIADFYSHLISLRSLVIRRMAYPAVLIHVALIMPLIPMVVLGTASPIMLLLGPGILDATLVVAGFAWMAALRRGVLGRIALVRPVTWLTLPLIAGNTCLVMRSALAAGMLFPEALELSARGCGNQVFARRLVLAARNISQGVHPDLTSALIAAGFPDLVCSLCRDGEVAGILEDALGRAARLCQETFKARSQATAAGIAAGIYLCGVVAAVAAIMYMFVAYELDPMQDAMRQMDGMRWLPSLVGRHGQG